MAGRQTNAREKALQLVKIADLWARGSSAKQISEKLGISDRETRRCLARLKEEWATTIADHDGIRMQQLAELAAVKSEAWAAWEKSQGEQRTVTIENRGGAGDSPLTNAGKKRAQLSRITSDTTHGDPRYMQLVLSAIDEQNKLLGLIIIKHADTDSRGNDRPVFTEEERLARLYAILEAARLAPHAGVGRSTTGGDRTDALEASTGTPDGSV